MRATIYFTSSDIAPTGRDWLHAEVVHQTKDGVTVVSGMYNNEKTYYPMIHIQRIEYH